MTETSDTIFGNYNKTFLFLDRTNNNKPVQMGVRECRDKMCPREGNADKKNCAPSGWGVVWKVGWYPYHTKKFYSDCPNEMLD